MNYDIGNFKGGFVEKKKNNAWKIILIIGLLLIAIAIGLYVGFRALAIDPKKVYERTINETYELISSYLDENGNTTFQLDYLEEPFIVNSEFNIYGDLEGFEHIEDYDFDVSLGLDVAREIMNVEMNLSTNNNHILNFLYSYMNNHMYLQSTDLYENIIDFGESDLSFEDLQTEELELPLDDIRVILREMKDIVIASLDERKFVVEDESIIINDEIVDCDRIAYILDEKNARRTHEFITNAILENEELMASLANLEGVDTNTLEYQLEQDLEMAEYQDSIFILYRNNNNIVASTLIEGEEEILHITYLDNELNMTLNNVEINGDTATINIYSNGEAYHLSIATESDIPYTIELDFSNTTLNVVYESDEASMTMDITNIDTSSRRISADMDLNVATSSYGVEETIGIRGVISLEKRSLTTLDTENAIYVDDIPESDMATIEQNLYRILDRLGLQDLYQTETTTE